MHVVVTGSSGCLAKALLPRLCSVPQVQRVLGIDIVESGFHHPKFESIVGDVREPGVLERMRGANAVIHLAFAIARRTLTDGEMHANNVTGTMALFASARSRGIRKIINLSSVSVYGEGENLVESAPLAPSPKFPYAEHKAEIERRCAGEFPEVLHLRAHFIFGPNAHDFLHAICNGRSYISFPKPLPRLQVIHEDDVVTAILLALQTDVSGAFNLAAEDIVTFQEFIRNGNGFMLPLPLGAIRAVTAVARRLGSTRDFTWLDIIDTTLTVNCAKAADVLKWQPIYSASAVRAAMQS